MAKQICNLEQVEQGFNKSLAFTFVLSGIKTDERRNHDVNEYYKLLLIIPCRIENVA